MTTRALLVLFLVFWPCNGRHVSLPSDVTDYPSASFETSEGTDARRRLSANVTCATKEPVIFMSYRGEYLSDQQGTVRLVSNSCGWEQWTIRDSKDGSVTIQSHTGKYLSSNHGYLTLVSSAREWEQFRIQYAESDDKMSLVNFEGKYLQDASGTPKFSDNAATWEQWRVMKPDESPACTVEGVTTNRTLPPCTSPAGCATLVQTARFTGDRLSLLGELPFEPDFPEDVVVDLSSSERDQAIVGFGGAFTETSAHLFKRLPAEKQKEVITKYFGNGQDNIGYNVGRVHINSCDFSLSNWDEDPVAGDTDLQHFDAQVSHDMEEMIPFIKAAMEKIETRGESLKLLASPWSPPAWMKKSGRMDSSSRGPNSCVKDEYVPTWAKYISKWITAYGVQGVPVWAVTVQNEPDNTPRWEACWFPMQDEAAFVRDYLGPELNKSHPDVGIFFMDSYQRFDIDKWASTFYHDSVGAAKYAMGIALHWYNGDYFSNIAQAHKTYPQALILQSEATWEFSRVGDFCQIEHGVWRFGEGYAHDIVGVLNAGGSGWIDWNLLLDKTGGPNHVNNMCDAAIMVDGANYYIHPQFWYMGHFSKFLPRGSRRIPLKVSGSRSYEGQTRPYGTCTKDDGLQATSFQKPDGSIALVVLNCGDDAIKFKIKKDALALRSSIPAHAIQTYLFKEPKARRLRATVV